MQKYFPSINSSLNLTKKNSVGMSSIILLSPQRRFQNSYKLQIQRSYNHNKTFTFRKQQNKTVTDLSNFDKQDFKTPYKQINSVQSTKNIHTQWKTYSNYLKKRKEFQSYKQFNILNLKELRQSDSTLCQSPKGQNIGLKITDFKKLRLIGNGKYGSVYMVSHRKTGFISALKIIRKIDIDCLQPKQKNQMINQLIRQIKIQMFLGHPNLIKLYAYFHDQYNIYLLMQLGCDGQLYDLMKKIQKLSQQSVSIITRQIIQGLHYMHNKKIIHRDIKPQNIVLIHGLAKICDFGWSVFCSKQLRSTFCGTPLYLSPQILKGNMYNQKIDTWAIGTLAYELFTSENPFKIKKKQELSKIITQDFVMRSGSFQLRDFITSILKKDPSKRPNTQKIKNHAFLNRYKQIDISEQICRLIYKPQHPVYRSCYK